MYNVVVSEIWMNARYLLSKRSACLLFVSKTNIVSCCFVLERGRTPEHTFGDTVQMTGTGVSFDSAFDVLDIRVWFPIGVEVEQTRVRMTLIHQRYVICRYPLRCSEESVNMFFTSAQKSHRGDTPYHLATSSSITILADVTPRDTSEAEHTG